MIKEQMLEEIKRLKAIAETGLLYCKNEYDRERYEEVADISFRLLSGITGYDTDLLTIALPAAKDYPTAKVDIRAFILSADGKVLLVKEIVDGRWSLPGGWADVGYSPKETVIKECKEETGLDVVPERLLAVFDKRLHAHPPQPFYVYKMFFYCKAVSTNLIKGFDVLDIGYFDVADLPELSQDRVLKSQIELLYKKVLSADAEASFD
jgi:ADP-ribose pyrophosphatase YjhB (NUDIX family)